MEVVMVKLTLDKFLDEKNVTRYRLSKLTGIEFQTIDRYYKNTIIRYDSYVLSKICEALGCEIKDILVYIPDEPDEKNA